MSEAIVETGDKLHIITRRIFPDDVRRHFVGEVTRAIRHMCHLQGYVFVFNSGTNDYQKRPERRTRIYSLADSNHIVNILPREIDVGALEYRILGGRLVVTDMKGFSLDINEFGLSS